jgi:hypothetical protein
LHAPTHTLLALINRDYLTPVKENKEDILRDGTKRHFTEFKINPLYTNQERFYHSEPKEPTQSEITGF